MRIHIPEFEPFNNSYFDSYKGIYSMISYQVLRLGEIYNTRAINNILGYQIGILIKIMRCFYSFMTVIEQCKDYIVAASVVRIIADNLASFLLIYHESTEEEKVLRHYLFILDGFDKRLKELEKYELKNKGSITVQEFEALKKQVENAIEETKRSLEFCRHTIIDLPIYVKNKGVIDILLKDYNWKYIDLNQPTKRISWSAMYQLVDMKKSMTNMIPFLSQYVHGLSVSNLTMNCNEEDFEPLISYAILLMGEIQFVISNNYGVDNSFLLDGFITSDYGKDYLSYYSKEKLQEFLRVLNEKGEGKS